jgi:TonB family protein
MPINCYQPTIIESGLLLSRLAREVEFLKTELQHAWSHCKSDPRHFAGSKMRDLYELSRRNARALPATTFAVVAIAIAISITLQIDRSKSGSNVLTQTELPTEEVVMLDPKSLSETKPDTGIGKDGKGRVGFQNHTGEGSGASPKLARGGGGGGEREPRPPQVGKLPPPSPILASIPKAPPINPPSLPAAGIDIDPALWKDLKAPVYGDPRSNSNVSSKGPGDGGGIGSNNGLGIGPGNGPGVGPGERGNIGGGSKELGCCGIGGAPDGSLQDRTFTGTEVEQRAKLLAKPEPQYTEEARKNQVTGTVALRVVFSSTGEVVQIRAVRTLPFGLTERAIAAARQIKFIPASKGGRAVSVQMQLEYNFNLY